MNGGEVALIAMVVVSFVCAALAASQTANRNADDPKIVLRRCRLELAMIRRELEQIPATREAHDVFAQIESTQRTIDETEAVLTRGNK